MFESIVGLDVGGANLKAAHAGGECRTAPFALWRDPAGLPAALRLLLTCLPPFDALAVTMTGELCDCFATKSEGVRAILRSVETAAEGKPILVWGTDGRFVDVAAACQTPLLVAAANWLALATWAGRLAPQGPAMLLDVGSTTTDVVPLLDGAPVPVGRTDPERLRSGELVYTGVRRTPVCALLGGDGAAEWFATTLDVYLLLGRVAEDPENRDTADGRPATIGHAHDRLARMFCADRDTCTPEERLILAEEIRARQLTLLGRAIDRVRARLPGPPATYLLAGSGEFLARDALADSAGAILSLAERSGPGISSTACAFAVARLCAEQMMTSNRRPPAAEVPG